MCFSPSVSFGASAVLAVTGAAAISRSSSAPQRLVAAIPLLFAVQQFSEGVVWMSLSDPDWLSWKVPATVAFLVFAQMIWPVWMPLCALSLERDPARKRMLGPTLAAGLALAAYIGIAMSERTPVAIASSHHIHYELYFSLAHKWYYGLLYIVPTVFSLLISSEKPLHWIGYLFIASYLFSRLLFHFYVVSIWCFFGAVISLLILMMIPKLAQNRKPAPARL